MPGPVWRKPPRTHIMPCLPYSSRALILTLVFLPMLGWNVVSTPLHNITITAPLGTTQHGDDHLFCVPTRPWDIIIFFLANYAAHAFTVRSYPGESLLDFTWGTVVCGSTFPSDKRDDSRLYGYNAVRFCCQTGFLRRTT